MCHPGQDRYASVDDSAVYGFIYTDVFISMAKGKEGTVQTPPSQTPPALVSALNLFLTNRKEEGSSSGPSEVQSPST